MEANGMGRVGEDSLSTFVVTLTEQQTTARNPVPVLPTSEWNLTVILVPVLVKGPGTEVPQ